MNFTSFFIKNPVFAIVLNTMLVVIGVLSLDSLLVREYPKVEIPMITVSTTYRNASPEVIESSVTNVLEDQLAGVEGIETVTSHSFAEYSKIKLRFLDGTSMDKAIASVRDAINMARDRLPREVREPAIYRGGQNGEFPPYILIALESATMNSLELGHFANVTIKNAFRSVDGVSSVQVWAYQYTTKINVDPQKLHMFGINVDEICKAIDKENISRPVGKIRNITPATLESELKSTGDFENIILKHQNFSDVKHKKRAVFLKDVATVELSDDSRSGKCILNGKTGTFIAINVASDANPVEVSNLVQKEIKKLEKEMSANISIYTILDQAEFVRSAIKNTETATFEAILLVLLIVFVFLRSARATLIPIITIPISIIGAIVFLKMFGFSINIMTLLAIVLAVGLVVDDAIVVLENISRHMENGLSRIEASLKGAQEIGWAIVAMTLTLVSVYAPFIFLRGAIGQLFIEFAVALAGSVLISGLVALTLSPLMCSVLLKQKEVRPFPQIDVIFQNFTEKYRAFLARMLQRKILALLVAAGSLVITGIFLATLPQETAPPEDRGTVIANLPSLYGKDVDYYEAQAMKVCRFLDGMSEIKYRVNFAYENSSYLFFPLIEKTKRYRSADEIVADLNKKVQDFPSQDVNVWSEDTNLPGISSNDQGSSRVRLAISTSGTYQELYENLEKMKRELMKSPLCGNPGHDLALNNLTYKIYIDQDKASKLGITNEQISKTLEVFFSGNRNLTFHKDGISYDILIESSEKPWDLSGIYVTNTAGKRISLDVVSKMVPSTEPKQFYHHNQMRAAKLAFSVPQNTNFSDTLGAGMKIINENLPQSYKKAPLGSAESVQKSSRTMMMLFVLAIVFIFAILSLQFNNFRDPLLILLTAPLACASALFSIWITGISLNIYTSVGLITLIGLITKHGILIVEFTNQLMAQGKSAVEAVQQAAVIRLRPILITTGAMFFGSIPLVIPGDYGFESRRCIGIILTGGLFWGTIFVLTIFPTLCCIFNQRDVGST
ncbi:membrane protein [Alphaproteobacteria bacterium]|nr:membrane protein [Alphaproteobacteria bacterium]